VATRKNRRSGSLRCYLNRNVLRADFTRAAATRAKNFGTSLLARTATFTCEALSPKTFCKAAAALGLE
jgi:hypothetical protein